MKRRFCFIMIFALLFSIPVSVHAASQDTYSIMQTRTEQEAASLKQIYQELFPEEYHYITNYEENGVEDMAQSDIAVVFEETKRLNNIDYTLLVFSNGQVFTNTYKEVSTPVNSITRGPDTVLKSGDFECGQALHYITFHVEYLVWYGGYDQIESYSTSGNGFLLTPLKKHFKRSEDSRGNAYIAYHNVQFGDNTPGPLYDIGVKVGADNASGFSKIGTGLDAFLSYLLMGII